jgi:hypothetical protein
MTKICVVFLVCIAVFRNKTNAQIYGCKDPLATNYNSSATVNDGSCLYNPISVSPTASYILDYKLPETSGLIKWDNRIWTHNDSGSDTNIYKLDTLNGNILQNYPLPGVKNTDWEEISQDADFVYIGDFGNNANGNRTDLKILRIDKNTILANSPTIETINFSYSNQSNFSATGSNNTDFDCEAFIVSDDSIYLFTKQWISEKTSVYSLPKSPGSHLAKLKSTYNVQGLITGATYLESKKLLVLCGYSKLLQPFIYLLYDFSGTDFFSGNKRKADVSLPFHQVEGIATTDGLKYYISNEKFTQQPINVSQKLHILNFSNLLGNYLNNVFNSTKIQSFENDLLFPNPAGDLISVKSGKINFPADYLILNQSNQIVSSGKLRTENERINISALAAGLYVLKIGGQNKQSFKVIKR